ncbi:syringate O-demethylase [Microbacterium trichothecenolyticum]|uniref:aminomethyl transferase family protein n=1 Tax=Microbacterium trichothecenolyticum TaxID=69370 RepID=UPI00285CC291|nr:aminomethyl transferase family protein [Microbacterium trichothecenolyticum]MDR7184349.1 syringate O-demethylase [Microbacterium trichothecenolyticum]
MAWEFVSLQQGIDEAGSPIRLLWKPGSDPWKPPVVDDEYAGWGAEQTAWRTDVTLSDLSFHMSDTFLRGPDARRLLGEVSANNVESFEIGQAKQFVPVAADGNIITDGILLRDGEESFVLSGVPAAQNWVTSHAVAGGYDVEFSTDGSMEFRFGEQPRLFRMQVQGPRALDVVHKAFGGPLPETKFFHSTPVTLAGRSFRALRHGMAGQAGYEFIGDYADHDAVKDALTAAGEEFGISLVGALSYATNGIESGWIPTPTPAIYTDPTLAEYRQRLGLFTYEGQNPLYGSFYSDRIEDYYTSPWELGYGRSISFNHDFIGRDALQAAKDQVHRTKVTLELDADDVRALGTVDAYLNNYGRQRIEAGDELVGTTFQAARIAPLGRVLALSLVDTARAAPGTQVEVVWGDHPGHGTDPDADLGFPRIRATVQPAPYNEYARTIYRKD